jgi:hypothetical protein
MGHLTGATVQTGKPKTYRCGGVNFGHVEKQKGKQKVAKSQKAVVKRGSCFVGKHEIEFVR